MRMIAVRGPLQTERNPDHEAQGRPLYVRDGGPLSGRRPATLIEGARTSFIHDKHAPGARGQAQVGQTSSLTDPRSSTHCETGQRSLTMIRIGGVAMTQGPPGLPTLWVAPRVDCFSPARQLSPGLGRFLVSQQD